MKRQFPSGILSAAAFAALVVCPAHSGVYSQSIVGGGQSMLPPTRGSEPIHLSKEGRADEVRVASYTHGVGSATSITEWYMSTNDLAKQPRWNGYSREVPLSIRDACALALRCMTAQFPEVKSWLVESVLLTQCLYSYPNDSKPDPDIWVYQITFTPRDLEIRRRFEGNFHHLPYANSVALWYGAAAQTRQS